MAIATYTPSSRTTKKPVITAKANEHIAIDMRVNPAQSLLTHVSGKKWTLRNYYNQQLTQDGEPTPLQLSLSKVNQQYLAISDLELRVSDALSLQQDSNTMEMTYTGAGTLLPGLIPIVGDMFVADIGDGRDGLFALTRAEQKSILKATTYVIEYTLVDYLTDEYRTNLFEKTVRTANYVVDYLALGKNPVLVEGSYKQYLELTKWKYQLAESYFRDFFNTEFNTFLLPEQPSPTYDPYLTEFVTALVSIDDNADYRNVNCLNVDTGSNTHHKTFWDALIARDDNILDHTKNVVDCFSVRNMPSHPRYSGIRYSGIDLVINYNDDGWPSSELSSSEPRVFNRAVSVETLFTTQMENVASDASVEGREPFKSVTEDNHYVLTEAFYNKDNATTSVLEILTQRCIDRKPIGIPTLLALCTSSIYWGRLEQFYYMPILMLLVRCAHEDIG